MAQQYLITVTVTYGDRWKHLEQVIPAVFQQGIVRELLIVDNASTYDLAARIQQQFPHWTERIILFTQAENLGSAGGFALGLQQAYARGAQLVYLLDDDNLPEPDALQHLCQAWEKRAPSSTPIAFLSFRYQNLPNLQKAALGQEVRYFRDKPNSFLGFSIIDSFTRRRQKTSSAPRTPELIPEVAIYQAPYGGLLLPRATIEAIGFPQAQLFLYADDTEYTYRIIERGGSIWMLTASRLKDLETSWWSDSRALNRRWSAPVLEEGGFKAYYSTRNLTWFLWNRLSPNPALFLLNGLIYLTYLWLVALVSGRLTTYPTIVLACWHGLRGKLGKTRS